MIINDKTWSAINGHIGGLKEQRIRLIHGTQEDHLTKLGGKNITSLPQLRSEFKQNSFHQSNYFSEWADITSAGQS